MEYCCICLSKNKFLLNDLFATQDVAENIKYCTGIRLPDENNLSLKICSICTLRIIIACQIRRKSLDSAKHAQQHQTFCMICLTSNSSALIDLSVPQDLAQNFEYFTGLQISEHDNQKICSICEMRLVISCQIKRKILTSEALRKIQINAEDPAIDLEIKTEEKQKPAKSEKDDDSNDDVGENYDFPEDITDFHNNESDFHEEDKTSKSRVKKESKESSKKPVEQKKKRPTEHDFKCFICNEIFDMVLKRQQHVKETHKDDPKVCSICSKRKPTSTSFDNHLREHFCTARFICSQCGKNFPYQARLDQHMKTHRSDVKEFTCDVCGYATKFKSNLLRHFTVLHMKSKNYHCTFENCPAKYFTKMALNLHFYRRHNVPAPINCPHCQRGFTLESEVKTHLKYCTGQPIIVKRPRMHNRKDDELGPYVRKPRKPRTKHFSIDE